MPPRQECAPTSRSAARWQTRLLGAAVPTLALAFVQPACFTTMVWQDTRSRPVEAAAKPEQVAARRTPEARSSFVVNLSPDLMAHYAEVDRSLAADATMLRIEPREHAATVATLLTMANVERLSNAERAHGYWALPPLELVLDEPSAGRREWRLRCNVGMGARCFEAVSHLPGFTKYTRLYTRYCLDVPCTVTSLTAAPELAEPVSSLSVAHVLPTTGSYRIVPRLLWTPVALVGDVLCAPWELLWWTMP